MISLTIEANDQSDLVVRLENALKIMGGGIGSPEALSRWSYSDMLDLIIKYNRVTGLDHTSILQHLFDDPSVAHIPVALWPQVVRALRQEMVEAQADGLV